MRHLKLTYNLLVALIAIAGFSGCSQDEFVERQEMQPQIEAQLMLSISMPQIGTRAVADLIEAKFPKLNGKVEINHIGTTIGSHTGPGTVALFFWGKKRED